jgi:hypothetical protein
MTGDNMYQMHMQVLKRSRRVPIAGDIFGLKVLPDAYHFGRLISTDGLVWPGINNNLLYIYQCTSNSVSYIPQMDRKELLIPPQITNQQPWLQGYFMHLANRSVLEEDRIRPNCFYSLAFEKYYDEYNNVLPRRYEPCGVRGLSSYTCIDKEIAKALGLSVAEDEIDDLVVGFKPLSTRMRNVKAVTLRLRILNEHFPQVMDMDTVEKQLDRALELGRAAKWVASEIHNHCAILDYLVTPGQLQTAATAMRNSLAEVGCNTVEFFVEE